MFWIQKVVLYNCSLIIITLTVYYANQVIYVLCSHLFALLNISDTLGLLLSPLSSLLTPGEMQDRHQEETVASVRNTSKHVPPSDERSNNTKGTSGKIEIVVGCGDAVNGGGVHVSGSEHEEGKPHGKEEGGKGDGGTEGKKPKDEGKDEPALDCVSGCSDRRESPREEYEHT